MDCPESLRLANHIYAGSDERPRLAFVVLEGFSGTGKTTLAKGLEEKGWLRLPESAHIVPKWVKLADRADTFADYSLLGATLSYCPLISEMRPKQNLVSEGYLLGDLAYARIRYDLGRSKAFPEMLEICRHVLSHEALRPDLYIRLQARSDTIETRQKVKDERDKNLTEFFRTRYYTALEELHSELGESRTETIYTDSDTAHTLEEILEVLESKGVLH